jgi:hypothetical protein
VSRRENLKLGAVFEQALDPSIKRQLYMIGARVYDLVAGSVTDARRGADIAAALEPLAAAHTMAINIFESECEGYFHNVPGGLELKQSLACKSGCAFCCHVKVELTAFEAVAIWSELRGPAFAGQRAKAAEQAPRLGKLTTEGRRVAAEACPLLVDNVCSVYATRPYVCRGMFATSASDCESVLKTPSGAPLPAIRSPAVPRALSSAFAAGVNAALADQGLQSDLLELTAAFATLATLARREAAVTDWLAGQKVFEPTLPL